MPIDNNSLVNCTVIYSGSSHLSEATVPELPQSYYHGLFYLEKLEAVRSQFRTQGIRVRLKVTGTSPTALEQSAYQTVEREIFFGDSCQDILVALGSPSKIFFKSEDKMRIHSTNTHLKSSKHKSSDYFYNYFTLGIVSIFE